MKLKQTTSVNKTTILNVLSTFILQGVSFLTIPIFTRMLGSEQFGIFSIYNSWVTILACVMGLNVCSSLGTGKYHFQEDYEKFRTSTLLLGTILSAIIIAICIALIVPLSNLMGYGYLVYVVMLFTAFGHFIINFAQLAFIYEKKPLSNFILSIIISLSTVVLSIVLIKLSQSETKYFGRIFGFSIPYIVLAVILWFLFFFNKPASLKKEYIKYALLLGVPIVFHSLSQSILAQSDRIMMQFMEISNSEIGIYSLFYSFTGVMVTILNALNNSWTPFFYDDLKRNDWDSLNRKSKNYIELFTIIISGFILLSREVSYLLANDEFWSGIELIPIIVSSCFFTFLYQFPVNFEFYNKKSFIIAIGTVSAALSNIGLNFVLIPIWGIYGAAAATAISYFLLFLMHFLIVKLNKKWEYKIKFTSFLPSILVVALICVIFYVFKDYVRARWTLGAVLGAFELYRVYKRKTIF